MEHLNTFNHHLLTFLFQKSSIFQKPNLKLFLPRSTCSVRSLRSRSPKQNTSYSRNMCIYINLNFRYNFSREKFWQTRHVICSAIMNIYLYSRTFKFSTRNKLLDMYIPMKLETFEQEGSSGWSIEGSEWLICIYIFIHAFVELNIEVA